MRINSIIGLSAFAAANLAQAAITVADGLDMDTTTTVTSGSNSIVAGTGNAADNESLALGFDNVADTCSLAAGYDVEVFNYSLGYGFMNTMSGASYYTLMGGVDNIVESATDSVVLGQTNVMRRQSSSLALGLYNSFNFPSGTSGTGNVLIGSGNTMDGTGAPAPFYSLQNCVMIGVQNESTTDLAWVMGFGNIAQHETVTLGKYAATVSDASLIVGNGTGTGSRSNSLVVLNNGNTSVQGSLTIGGSPAVTSGYLSTNKYLTASYGAGASAAATAIGALGTGATATHADSFSVGNSADATNTGAIAIGSNSSATGIDAVSIGYATYARAQRSFAASTGGVNASGYGGSALSGGLSEAVHAVALGQGTAARAFSSVSVGSHPITEWGDSASTWVATDSVFTVGNGTTYGGPNQSNALKILKNGKATFKNKKWSSGLGDPDAGDGSDAAGVALRVEGHTELQGKVTIAIPQGDISMGDFE
ncbi:hypothetical protein [Luteolibacter sp. Populi]|uniref:hypothetical protein n=1 Tax=Luteolibacter sp. Populi TaxID=3230487 RepID=UPI003465862D